MERKDTFLNTTLPLIALWTVPLLVVCLGCTVYAGYQYMQKQQVVISELEQQLNQQMEFQSKLLASTTESLTQSINLIEKNLQLAKTESLNLTNAIAASLTAEQEKLALLEKETDKIGGTLGDIEKLSQIDSELLMKYSKVYFLNEHYDPVKLSQIPNQYLYSEKETKLIHSNVSPHLTQMIDDALSQDIEIYIKSAYRSFNEQESIKDNYSITYGENTANTFSADQGYSEHQLGTTVDLITIGLGGQLHGFETTEAYTWLTQNAYKYGFTMSYPKNNEHYIYEPWHWRYVGIDLATRLQNEELYFYDMDQRDIDVYLISLFD